MRKVGMSILKPDLKNESSVSKMSLNFLIKLSPKQFQQKCKKKIDYWNQRKAKQN